MEAFSLEDDNGDLFITQESKEMDSGFSEKIDGEHEEFLVVPTDDFQSPCVSLVSRGQKYQPDISDISDNENQFEMKQKE